MNPNLEEMLRHAILTSGMSQYRIAQRTGIPTPVLSLFVREQQGLHLTTAQKLMDLFGMKVVVGESSYSK